MICIDLGTMRIFWRYNDKGQQIKSVLYGPDGAPIYDRSERTNLKQRERRVRQESYC
jgi:hypothetical protein